MTCLPTRTPMPIPPEFAEVFVREGWRKCERMWGKASSQVYRRALGAAYLERLRELHNAD